MADWRITAKTAGGTKVIETFEKFEDVIKWMKMNPTAIFLKIERRDG